MNQVYNSGHVIVHSFTMLRVTVNRSEQKANTSGF